VARTPSFGLDGGETPSASQVLFAATCWLLAVVTVVGAVVLAMAGAMSSDPCRPGDEAFICTGAGQNLAWWLPLAGWAVSILLTWAIAVRLGQRSTTRWLGLAAGLAVYSAVLVVDWVLVAR
jgi:hypothetical protein